MSRKRRVSFLSKTSCLCSQSSITKYCFFFIYFVFTSTKAGNLQNLILKVLISKQFQKDQFLSPASTHSPPHHCHPSLPENPICHSIAFLPSIPIHSNSFTLQIKTTSTLTLFYSPSLFIFLKAQPSEFTFSSVFISSHYFNIHRLFNSISILCIVILLKGFFLFCSTFTFFIGQFFQKALSFSKKEKGI